MKLMNRSLRILHLITTLDVGGAECMLLKLINSAIPDFQHKVIYLKGNGKLVERFDNSVEPPICLNLKGSLRIANALKMLINQVNDYQPDIIQTWLYHADLFGLLVGKIAHAPVILWNVRCSYIDFSDYALSSKLIFKVLTHLSTRPTGVIFNSESGRKFHQQCGYRPKLCQVIPNGFDIHRFRPNQAARKEFRSQLGIRMEAPVIGMVARYDPIKRYPVFIQAARILLESISDVKFVLVGEGVNGENRVLDQQIASLGLGDHFYLLDNRPNLHDIYPIFDINTLTSYSEGFPNVIGEAMASGVPCVATMVGDAEKIIGDTGIIIPVDRPQRLAEAWKEMLALSMEDKMRLSRAARKRVVDNFDILNVTKQYESLYRWLAGDAEHQELPKY
jgi:glycosyltransferase involved in cell wall biosynthesis